MILKPTMNELVQPQPGKRAMAAFRAAMKTAQKEQARMLKKAAKIEKQA